MTRVCLTFDFDAVAIWVSTFKQTSASPISRGEFGARVGIPRILELLRRKSIRGTFFVPAHTALSFPDAVRLIEEEGHEIGSHGMCHESPVGLDSDEEIRLLERSIAGLKSILGTSFAPRGYRSPAWDLSPASIAILESHGYLYDSSLMGTDFTPYYARRGDVVNEERFLPGEESSVVEIPVAWELDDYPYFHWSSKPLNPGTRPVDEVLRIWTAEFDYCNQHVRDGVFTLTTHPEISGRGPRIQMLEALIDHIQARPNVFFCAASEAALAWRDAQCVK